MRLLTPILEDDAEGSGSEFQLLQRVRGVRVCGWRESVAEFTGWWLLRRLPGRYFRYENVCEGGMVEDTMARRTGM